MLKQLKTSEQDASVFFIISVWADIPSIDWDICPLSIMVTYILE